MSTPQIKLGKAIEVLLWIAALAVLAANIALLGRMDNPSLAAQQSQTRHP